ncbi:MAG: sulfatase-like hydrolase/transferase, partial [Planctomycetota bacterium]
HTYAIHNYYAPAELVREFDTGPETSWRGDLSRRLNPPYWRAEGQAPLAGDAQHLVDLYDATIRYADLELARMFDRLESQGLLADTLVVITSDHGEEFLEHGGLQHSLTLFEEQLRVPLMIRLPHGSGGTRIHDPVIQADLAPTLVDLLGLRGRLPDPSCWQNSRANLLTGNADTAPSTPLLAQIDRADARAIALRHGDLKLLWSDTTDQVLFPAPREWSLFDLRLDPEEAHDLALTHASLLKQERERFERIVERLRRDALEVSARPLDSDTLEQLRALGY